MIHADVDQLFHALGDPTRRAILDRLSERASSVTRLAEHLGVTPTAVGQHLQVLQASGLARTEKVGRVRTCAIAPEGFSRLEQWIAAHRAIWAQRLDRLGEVLDED